MLPALVFAFFVLGYPLGRVIYESFTSKTLLGDPGSFIGVENYLRLFDTPLFWRAFLNNLILLLSVPITIVVGLVLSAILYRGIWGSRLYEFFIFLPFLPAVARHLGHLHLSAGYRRAAQHIPRSTEARLSGPAVAD